MNERMKRSPIAHGCHWCGKRVGARVIICGFEVLQPCRSNCTMLYSSSISKAIGLGALYFVFKCLGKIHNIIFSSILSDAWCIFFFCSKPVPLGSISLTIWLQLLENFYEHVCFIIKVIFYIIRQGMVIFQNC